MARLYPTAETVLFVVLAGGIASFVVVHSIVLLNASGEQTASMFRRLWFLGLALTTIAVIVTQLAE